MNITARKDNLVPLLTDIALFGTLTSEQLRFLAVSCFPRRVPKGRLIFDKGEQLNGFYAVRTGRVKLAILSPEGADRVVQIALAGDALGEAMGLLQRPSPVYAQALCSSELLFFRRDRVLAAAARWPNLGMLFLEQACERVHQLVQDLEACCLQSAMQRVAGYLLDNLCPRRDANCCGEAVLPAGKAVVASRLNLTPETFSRELRHLSSKGIISVERCTVLVLDAPGLRVAAGRD
jgi:CRP-like cAMP-binding protein